jgi:hypothetical protein
MLSASSVRRFASNEIGLFLHTYLLHCDCHLSVAAPLTRRPLIRFEV